MSSESNLPDLPGLRRQLDSITGGAPARTVLAEVAQSLAADLAVHFDELPMHQFSGMSERNDWLRWLLPTRVPHKLLLGRYLRSSVPRKASEQLVSAYVSIAVLGLGADGVLRRGKWTGMVRLFKDNQPSLDPLEWNDIRLRGVPSNILVMKRWGGTPDPRDVASPAVVIEALTKLAEGVAAESSRDLALLKRFLADGA
jgi:hypothetical protein